jgi:hypothetical protein
MLNSYLESLANKLDQKGMHPYADAVDNIRIAQLTMPDAFGAEYDISAAAEQEIEKLTAQQAAMVKAVESDIKELKDMRGVIGRGAKDFWRFRRSKYQNKNQPAQQQVTDMNAFGLRATPAPQLRNSQTAPQGRIAPVQNTPMPNMAYANDEVEEFFQWLEAEQASKMQQNNGMGMNMNLPFNIG